MQLPIRVTATATISGDVAASAGIAVDRVVNSVFLIFRSQRVVLYIVTNTVAVGSGATETEADVAAPTVATSCVAPNDAAAVLVLLFCGWQNVFAAFYITSWYSILFTLNRGLITF